MDEPLSWLQQWYWRHCDGDWEHSYGITIDTMDNPGWSVTIDLEETALAQESFDAVSVHRGKYDWLECSVVGSKFQGYCSPTNLSVLVGLFASWARNHHESTDIFVAVEHGDIEAIEEIAAESPEQIERTDGDWPGYTPLYYAVAKGNANAAELLLRSGADVNSTSPETGWSPIFPAVSEPSMTSLLLRYGASVRVSDSRKRTPLHTAAAEGRTAEAGTVARLLLEHGADPNAADEDGNTPLHVAATIANVPIVRCLLSWGANTSLPNAEGITPKQLALDREIDIDHYDPIE